MKVQSPSPQAYTIGDSIGYDDNQRQSPFTTKNMTRAIFGRENRDKQFTMLLKPNELVDMPGPGQYSHYTEFNNEAKHATSVTAKRTANK